MKRFVVSAVGCLLGLAFNAEAGKETTDLVDVCRQDVANAAPARSYGSMQLVATSNREMSPEELERAVARYRGFSQGNQLSPEAYFGAPVSPDFQRGTVNVENLSSEPRPRTPVFRSGPRHLEQ